MTRWIRTSVLLALLSAAACAAVVATSPPPALAAEGEGTTTEETTTPVIELPTEVEVPPVETPAVETPVTVPPVELPSAADPTSAPGETSRGGSSPAGSESAGGGGGGGGGGGSTGTSTSSAGTVTTHQASHVRSHPTTGSGGSSSGSKAGSGGGTGGSKPNGAGHHASSGLGASVPHNPTVSPAAIDEGASAVSHVAAHVGEVVAEVLPTAPLKKIGARLAAHVGLVPAKGGDAQHQAVDKIGTALGAALIGSAVAVQKPPASHGPIPFFDPPGGKSGTIYLVLVAALLLAAGALVVREARSALGLSGKGVRVAGERPRLISRAEETLARARYAGDRSLSSFRRFSANAVAGVRSLF